MESFISSIEFSNDYWFVLLPSLLMIIDVLTGFLNAWIKNEIKSSKMREGLGRKFGELVILAIGQLFFFSVGLSKAVVGGLSFYIILMEIISICENLQKLGVPIPAFIKRALKDAEKKIEDDPKLHRKEDNADE